VLVGRVAVRNEMVCWSSRVFGLGMFHGKDSSRPEEKEDILPRMRLTRRTKKVCCLSAFPFISMQLPSSSIAKTSLEMHN